jgi:peptidoglycan/xylan/chitin deacetylase (PgdA/CDA1 family)
MPDGSRALPPAVTGPPAAAVARCPAAPYGPRFLRPRTGKTVALTFDDGPGVTTAAILAVLARYQVPATFFNMGVNMAARPWLVQLESSARQRKASYGTPPVVTTGQADGQGRSRAGTRWRSGRPKAARVGMSQLAPEGRFCRGPADCTGTTQGL